jgi:hypothetical protein
LRREVSDPLHLTRFTSYGGGFRTDCAEVASFRVRDLGYSAEFEIGPDRDAAFTYCGHSETHCPSINSRVSTIAIPAIAAVVCTVAV